MPGTNYHAFQRRNQLTNFSDVTPLRSKYIEINIFGETIKALLASGINIHKYDIPNVYDAVPNPVSLLKFPLEGALEPNNFFVNSIYFVRYHVPTFSQTTLFDPGVLLSDYTFSENYRTPTINVEAASHFTVAQRFRNFDSEEFTLAFLRKSGNIKFKTTNFIGGIEITTVDTDVVYAIMRDIPYQEQQNSTFIRVKLVKVDTIVAVPITDVDYDEGFRFVLSFPYEDFYPNNLFNILRVFNSADPDLSVWKNFSDMEQFETFIGNKGTKMQSTYEKVTIIPDLKPWQPQAGIDFTPKRCLIGEQGTLYAGDDRNTPYYVSFNQVLDTNRLPFFRPINKHTDDEPPNPEPKQFYCLYSPQTGELTSTIAVQNMTVPPLTVNPPANVPAYFDAFYAYIPDSGMQYFYDNPYKVPLREIGCTTIPDTTYFGDFAYPGILAARYMYQRDWNDQVACSPHYMDTLIMPARPFNFSVPDGVSGVDALTYWKVFLSVPLGGSPPLAVNDAMLAGFPSQNIVLPCNKLNIKDGHSGDIPDAAKCNPSMSRVTNGGGNRSKFVFIENRLEVSWASSASKTYSPSWQDADQFTVSPRNFNQPLLLRKRVWLGGGGTGTSGYDQSGTLASIESADFSIAYLPYEPNRTASTLVYAFDMYDVNDNKNTSVGDLGPHLKVIGLAEVNCSPVTYSIMTVGQPGTGFPMDPNNPPAGSFFAVTLELRDRIGRPAPYMAVKIGDNGASYYQSATGAVNSWSFGFQNFIADSSGQVNLFIYPIISSPHINNNFSELPVHIRAGGDPSNFFTSPVSPTDPASETRYPNEAGNGPLIIKRYGYAPMAGDSTWTPTINGYADAGARPASPPFPAPPPYLGAILVPNIVQELAPNIKRFFVTLNGALGPIPSGHRVEASWTGPFNLGLSHLPGQAPAGGGISVAYTAAGGIYVALEATCGIAGSGVGQLVLQAGGGAFLTTVVTLYAYGRDYVDPP